MVIQKTIHDLKERPKDERQVIAIGGAGAVVLVLLIAWAFFFMKYMRAQNDTLQPDDTYANIVDTGSSPVPQTNASYNSSQAQDQFGTPSGAQ